MSKLDSIYQKICDDIEDGAPSDTLGDFKQQIKDLMLKLVDDELGVGCEGYEESRDSVRCRWCGETEFSNVHNKSRLIKKVKEL